MSMLAYIDAGTVAAIGAVFAGGLAGIKVLISSIVFGKKSSTEDTPSTGDAE